MLASLLFTVAVSGGPIVTNVDRGYDVHTSLPCDVAVASSPAALAPAGESAEDRQYLALVGKRRHVRNVDLVTITDAAGNSETCTDGSCSAGGSCSDGACSSCASGSCGSSSRRTVVSKAIPEESGYSSGGCSGGSCGGNGRLGLLRRRR